MKPSLDISFIIRERTVVFLTALLPGAIFLYGIWLLIQANNDGPLSFFFLGIVLCVASLAAFTALVIRRMVRVFPTIRKNQKQLMTRAFSRKEWVTGIGILVLATLASVAVLVVYGETSLKMFLGCVSVLYLIGIAFKGDLR